MPLRYRLILMNETTYQIQNKITIFSLKFESPPEEAFPIGVHLIVTKT